LTRSAAEPFGRGTARRRDLLRRWRGWLQTAGVLASIAGCGVVLNPQGEDPAVTDGTAAQGADPGASSGEALPPAGNTPGSDPNAGESDEAAEPVAVGEAPAEEQQPDTNPMQPSEPEPAPAVDAGAPTDAADAGVANDWGDAGSRETDAGVEVDW